MVLWLSKGEEGNCGFKINSAEAMVAKQNDLQALRSLYIFQLAVSQFQPNVPF